uniref:5'-nucleotidase SurE n=1 Tax=uncultured Chloroflexota bacterium TaxID=166587 RepID=H5SAL7_9CHLR|nr:stationary-phase survival protein SurE [uncultured Chloroflexota bacterium]
MAKRQILLTNDDGIGSPGLWTAAEALSALGFVTVVAPRHQSSGMGRSLPNTSDGIIYEETVQVKGESWKVYSVGGSPAQAVLHGILEIMPQPPHLVVSGINYGENVGLGVTISGTVGAALEAAALGYPALAVSLETDQRYHLSHSTEVDFSAAAHFTALFARLLLEKEMPFDVDVLKVEVPSDATPETPWEVTRLSRQRYYEPVPPKRSSWSEPAKVGYIERAQAAEENSDVYVLREKRHVAVTPLSLDLTSRVDLTALEQLLRA